ncbi:ABC transporter related [Methylobacterium sp. 4-46]|uniref:ABC transporter ATP-binding protein n=1 Tax=unclassified Methylobacterium TaxID=2615210 RepID=UPI000152D84C|nr:MULTISPECIES: ABC transporter ATP-binding protein [Methylobacterium]ACA17282.1 ABC transporter related [Methylobacterium sp. 4-46]WFT82968.1 ABC transporter ATP-binding protein [Methylobacterium nodulans]
MTGAVELRGVTKRYGAAEAVRDVSFTLASGAVALVGHNGAGKTTLMKLMLGLIRANAGSVQVLGENPAAGQFAARRRLGYLPENVSFNGALTGRETLSFYARLKRAPETASLRLLERVGLGEASHRRVGTYSKGMRQRLGLAQALIGEPEVLLLDEPTTGLDPALRLAFYDIVRALAGRGATVLLSSHALSELEDRADRVIIMDRGRMAASGSLEELRRVARLPVRIRIRPGSEAPVLPAGLATARRLPCGALEFAVADHRKVAMLRTLLCAGSPPEDIDVLSPTLDDLYAHFLRDREPAA